LEEEREREMPLFLGRSLELELSEVLELEVLEGVE